MTRCRCNASLRRTATSIFLLITVLLLSVTGLPAVPADAAVTATTGCDVPGMASFDRIVPALMQKHGIPGGAVAVARNGRLVFARGYGTADVATGEPVRPDALFRIASVSKPITAAALLVLVEQERLKLDDRIVPLLRCREPWADVEVDERLRRVTIRQLLHHTGGFDRGASFDPMLSPTPIVDALPSPADTTAVIRFMLPRPLDFEPGRHYAYSNFGYCLLGRVIETVTEKPYAEAVEQLVLRPAGITRMRLGRTAKADRAEGEVCYGMGNGKKAAGSVDSVFPDVENRVPAPYGKYHIEAMDAHGGWIASAVDLVRFATWVDGRRRPGLLKPETK